VPGAREVAEFLSGADEAEGAGLGCVCDPEDEVHPWNHTLLALETVSRGMVSLQAQNTQYNNTVLVKKRIPYMRFTL